MRVAEQLSQELLGDIRSVVQAIRDSRGLDLHAARRALGASMQKPALDIVIDDGVRVDDPAQAEALLRLVQEALTNAARHAGADIRMPGIDGIEALVQRRARGEHAPVLLLTTFDNSDLLLRAIDAGAQGFLLKDAAPEDLRDAITRAAAGETLLQPVSTDPMRARYRYRDESAPTDTFGEREVAFLRLLAGGYSKREIARSLFLAEGTVKNYVSAILDKLGTRDRTRVVLKAITLRLI